MRGTAQSLRPATSIGWKTTTSMEFPPCSCGRTGTVVSGCVGSKAIEKRVGGSRSRGVDDTVRWGAAGGGGSKGPIGFGVVAEEKLVPWGRHP